MNHFFVTLTSVAHNESELIQISEDIAWEAVMSASHAEGIDVGSDDFIAAYEHLKGKYALCAKSFGHLNYLSMALLSSLVDSGMAVVCPPEISQDTEKVKEHLTNLVGMVMSVVTSVYCVGPTGWIDNKDWNDFPVDKRSIDFEFVTTNKQETHDNND